MVTERKPITVREFVEALKKNGYPKIRGQYIQYSINKGEIVGACAYGQAAINLGIPNNPGHLLGRFSDYLLRSKKWRNNPPNIIYLNDGTDKSVTEIGKIVEKWAIKMNIMDEEL